MQNNVNSALAYCEQQLEQEGDDLRPTCENPFYEDLLQATELQLTRLSLGCTTV